MAWIEPKTNWESTDYFNIVDYNRIVGNLLYLKDLSLELFKDFATEDMADNKDYSSMIYAREINAIENNLEAVNINTYNFDIGDTKEFYPNKTTPLWSEFNRIESAMLLLHNTMLSHKNALPRLAFTLGGQKGLKV